MRFVLSGITGFRNRGVEAIVAPSVHELQARFHGCEVEILSHTPAYDAARFLSPGVTFLRNDFRNRRTDLRARLRRIYTALVHLTVRRQEGCANRSIASASMVLASGGDVFSSDYGNLRWHLMPLAYAQQQGVPVVFLAHSIGPFKTAEEAESWLDVARRSPLITVRETMTYRYVTEDLGLSTDNVKLVADPAFLLRPPPRNTVDDLLAFHGLQGDQPIIGLSVSQGIARFSDLDDEEHFRRWCDVIQFLRHELQAQVLVAPHAQSRYVENDDRHIATRLVRACDFDPSVHLLGGDFSASEFKGLIGRCDMLIAERMHAAIAGLSSGVCTIAVGYSVKGRGIMTDLLGGDVVEEGLLIPVGDYVRRGDVDRTIGDVWTRRGEVCDRLAKALPEVRKRASSSFEWLAHLPHASSGRSAGD